jgi:hypothetical protein
VRARPAALASFDAFRQRNYEPYLEYAALRLGQRHEAETTVAAAFTELAVSWTAVLGTAGPAAIAWHILHDHIDHALGHPARPGPAEAGRQQDARLLHHDLRLSSERTAEVMGIPPSDIAGLLPRPTHG